MSTTFYATGTRRAWDLQIPRRFTSVQMDAKFNEAKAGLAQVLVRRFNGMHLQDRMFILEIVLRPCAYVTFTSTSSFALDAKLLRRENP